MPEARDGDAIVVRQADLGYGGRPVLHHVDLRVADGSHVLVVGDNGSGKSTLLASLVGLLRPRRGTVTVHGLDPARDRVKLHAGVGYLGHKDALYPELTVRENLDLHARLRGLDEAAVDRALDAAGMTDAQHVRGSACSRGMARRAAVARALLGRPRLLVLDEPDSGLDTASRERLARTLAALGVTTVLTSHHPDAFAGWTHRRIRVHDGALHEEDAA